MVTLGYLTKMLKPEHIAQGYRLTEDDHFIYLWIPGETTPKVFSFRGATIESIETYIGNREV